MFSSLLSTSPPHSLVKPPGATSIVQEYVSSERQFQALQGELGSMNSQIKGRVLAVRLFHFSTNSNHGRSKCLLPRTSNPHGRRCHLQQFQHFSSGDQIRPTASFSVIPNSRIISQLISWQKTCPFSSVGNIKLFMKLIDSD